MQEMAGLDGIFAESGRLYTLSSDPGKRVYGERLVSEGGAEYREWNPFRSKMAAYVANGGRDVPVGKGSTVLYLGASSGTTPSHVSDIVRDGRVICIEFAQRMFVQLVRNCESRPNMMPVLADATRPAEYAFAAESVDVVYQDVAQKNQADILADNMEFYGAEHGMVAIKARSEDVTQDPARIFAGVAARLEGRGLEIVDRRSLEPFEKAHMMFVVRR